MLGEGVAAGVGGFLVPALLGGAFASTFGLLIEGRGAAFLAGFEGAALAFTFGFFVGIRDTAFFASFGSADGAGAALVTGIEAVDTLDTGFSDSAAVFTTGLGWEAKEAFGCHVGERREFDGATGAFAACAITAGFGVAFDFDDLGETYRLRTGILLPKAAISAAMSEAIFDVDFIISFGDLIRLKTGILDL